jgi:hypothetical protein
MDVINRARFLLTSFVAAAVLLGQPTAASATVGQSLTNQQAVSYAALKAALGAGAKGADDATAVAHLPLADPTPGKNFAMSI